MPGPELALDRLAPDRATLTARAAEAIRDAIGDGRLAGGERYSVAQLAGRFGVSRTPVREALLLLERQGLVRFERNKGVRVLATTAQDVEDVFALRLLLEVPATRRAAERLDADGLAALDRELAAMAGLARDGDEAAFMAHDERFHDLVLRAAGNRRLAGVVAELRHVVRGRGASTVGRSRGLRAIHREHAAILSALRRRDAPAAAEAMRAHLERTARLLLAQERAAGSVPPWAAVAGDRGPEG